VLGIGLGRGWDLTCHRGNNEFDRRGREGVGGSKRGSIAKGRDRWELRNVRRDLGIPGSERQEAQGVVQGAQAARIGRFLRNWTHKIEHSVAYQQLKPPFFAATDDACKSRVYKWFAQKLILSFLSQTRPVILVSAGVGAAKKVEPSNQVGSR